MQCKNIFVYPHPNPHSNICAANSRDALSPLLRLNSTRGKKRSFTAQGPNGIFFPSLLQVSVFLSSDNTGGKAPSGACSEMKHLLQDGISQPTSPVTQPNCPISLSCLTPHPAWWNPITQSLLSPAAPSLSSLYLIIMTLFWPRSHPAQLHPNGAVSPTPRAAAVG